MNMRLITAATVLSVSGLAVASAAHASGLAFRFGEDSFGASIAGNLSADSSAQLDWLHHDDGANLVSAGLFANGQRGSLSGRVGVKAIGLDGDDNDVDGGALAFGGDLSLPMNDLLRLRSGVYYGPSATSFSDVDGYLEWSISAEIALFQNSALQIGYAEYEFEVEDAGDYEFEDGVFVRLQLRL